MRRTSFYPMKQFFKKGSEFLSLNRNVAVLGGSLFGLGLGEELWLAYLPLYLTALGASGFAVGLVYSFRDFLDGIYQYPGGWVNDRFGRKQALMLFTLIALGGYVVIASATHWGVVFAGILLVMAWKAGAFPATFAVIAEALPAGKRGIAFSVQSILVRVPRVIAAPLGGLIIGGIGVVAGMRAALGVTVLIAIAVFLFQRRGYKEPAAEDAKFSKTSPLRVFNGMPAPLKQLLVAECFIRIGEGIAGAFVVLYVISVQHFSPGWYGVMYALQQAIAITLYLPAGKLADVQGRRLPVILTFIAFAIFPLAVYLADSLPLLVLAFLIGGLKEFGEPARKSIITDLADPAQMGRSVGVYYTIRNLLVVPAGAFGGFLWQYSVELPFLVAFGVGLLGVLVYIVSSKNNTVYS